MLKTLGFNFFGTVFDKALPFLVVVVANKFMQTNEFGLWALFSQFQIAVSSIIFSPVFNRFMREFGQGVIPFFSLKFSNAHVLLFLMSLFGLGFYVIYDIGIGYMVLLLVYSLFFSIYNYAAIQLRFYGRDSKYAIYSVMRLAILVIMFFLFTAQDNQMDLSELLISMILSHVPIFFISLKSISLNFSNDQLKEYFHLAAYGTTSTLTNGIEKFSYSYIGLSTGMLGYYHLIYSISSFPTVLVEVLKKTYQPKIYKNLGEKGVFYKGFKVKFIYSIVFLTIFQLTMPVILYLILRHWGLLNKEYMSFPNSVEYIVVLSTGLSFYNVYHFLNPIFFFNKKSMVLMLVQIGAVLVFLGLVFVLVSEVAVLSTLDSVILAKAVMLLLVLVFTIVCLKKYDGFRNL